jgi:NAD(P)-dependent dehydrogenase (short-subunit alcohol dehydrogenase family)
MAQPVAIVTGGGRGIGAACARELANRGYALALMSPSDSSIVLGAELDGFGISGSVTVPANLERLVAMTLERHGRIDAVINNTGRHGHFATYEDDTVTGPRLGYDPNFAPNLTAITDDGWHDALDMLVLSVIRMSRLVADIMVEQGGGAIVNISDMLAPEPRLVYPVTVLRRALGGFTKLFAGRYGRHGVRMNNLLPGFVDNYDATTDDILRVIPMARSGTVGEIAATAAFLLSDDAGYITGQSIVADGALNRGIR